MSLHPAIKVCFLLSGSQLITSSFEQSAAFSTMELPFILGENQSLNSVNYVREHPGVAISYLTILSVAMVIGTAGNILVIFAVVIEKVCIDRGNCCFKDRLL